MKAAERFFHMGNEKLANGDPRKAISLYNRSLKKSPGNMAVLMNKAGALMDLGIFTEALETIDAAIKIDSGIAKCWGMRGDIVFALGRHNEALSNYDTAINLDPYDIRLTEYKKHIENTIKGK